MHLFATSGCRKEQKLGELSFCWICSQSSFYFDSKHSFCFLIQTLLSTRFTGPGPICPMAPENCHTPSRRIRLVTSVLGAGWPLINCFYLSMLSLGAIKLKILSVHPLFSFFVWVHYGFCVNFGFIALFQFPFPVMVNCPKLNIYLLHLSPSSPLHSLWSAPMSTTYNPSTWYISSHLHIQHLKHIWSQSPVF